jgi:hypothetical protein
MDEDLPGDPGLDDELRRTFDRAAPAVGSTDCAWEQITPRLHRARRRHRAATAGASLIVLLGISATVLATDPLSTRTDVITPAGRPVERPTGTRETTSTTSTVPALPDTTPTDSVPPAVDDPVGGSGGAGSAPGDPAATPTTTTTTSLDETSTYTAPGGRATVRVSGGVLTLVDFSANPGYAAEVEKSEPDDVEVRFRPASGPESRIRVRLQNGAVSAETE